MAKKATMKKVLNCFVIIAILMSTIPAIAMNGNNVSNNVSNDSDPSDSLSSTVIYVPDDYPTIQRAVDAAKSGAIIIVRDGRYTENVVVNKPHLTIRSDNGAGATIVQAANSNDKAFEVTADYVSVSGFTFKGANYTEKAGIYLANANYCNVSDNTAYANYVGIYLWKSNNNTVIKNTLCTNDNAGLRSCHSSGNVITKNNVSRNYWNGIVIDGAYNTLSDNVASSNSYSGILVSTGSNNIICNNDIGSNKYYGIRFSSLWDSCNNIIYLNSFVDNSANFYSNNVTNIWSSLSKITYTYNGNTYTSHLGNYWDDYMGSDANGDGIGDTYYSIDSDSDNYPLIDMFENYRIGDGEKIERVIATQITAGADDGFAARTPEVFRADSTGITLGTALKFAAFLRFSDLKIPANATITKADITVVPTVTNQAGPMVNISAADNANPSAPTTASDFYARNRTESSVNWNASSWNAGESENSTDISNVIQELVDSYDYSAGAPILIFLDIAEEGTDNQYFAAYEHAAYEPAELHIEYT